MYESRLYVYKVSARPRPRRARLHRYIYISMKKLVINCLAPMPHICADVPYMCPIYVQGKKLVINCLAPMPPRSPCTRWCLNPKH